MAVQDVTKPIAKDETLQATNAKLDVLAKDLTAQALNTTLGAVVTALGLLGTDNTLSNKLQAIADAILNSSIMGDTDISQIADGTVTGAIAQFDSDISDLESDISDLDTAKADKVSSATNGNLAGLNGSGNLTDSGWDGAKDTTSISGNPISISGLKTNQLAVNPIITLEPIQAGSGTPSPVNQRPISGYDKVEALSCGVNVWDEEWRLGNYSDSDGSWTTGGTSYVCNKDPIRVIPNTSYYIVGTCRLFYYTASGEYIDHSTNISGLFTTPANCAYINIRTTQTTSYMGGISINYPATQTSYVSSNKTTSISESLGQTVYGGSLDVRTGKLTVTHKMVDMGDYTWVYRGSSDGVNYFNAAFENMLATAGEHSFICECYDSVGQRGTNYTISRYNMYDTSAVIYVNDNRYSGDATGAAALKTALAGVKMVYELATPFTIQLTPHEISLLKDYAYVSTNGTNIALAYHNGELASLADVSQLGETVNELGNRVDNFLTVAINGVMSSTAGTEVSVNIPTGWDFTRTFILGYTNKNSNGHWYAKHNDINIFASDDVGVRIKTSATGFLGQPFRVLLGYLKV